MPIGFSPIRDKKSSFIGLLSDSSVSSLKAKDFGFQVSKAHASTCFFVIFVSEANLKFAKVKECNFIEE